MRRVSWNMSFVVLALLAPLQCLAVEQEAQPESLSAVLDRQLWQGINRDPELRSLLGVSGGEAGDTSDRLTDVSLPQRAQLLDFLETSQAELKAWDRTRLEGQDRWSHELASWFYTSQIDMMRFDWAPAWIPVSGSTYAVDQLFSIPVTLPQFMDNGHPVVDDAGALNYIARLRAMATKLDQVRANFDLQARHGVIPPQVALEGAATQIRSLLQPAPDASVFVRTLQSKLDKVSSISPTRREELIALAVKAVEQDTRPAYERMLVRLDEVIARKPGSRGVWALPQGAAYHDAALRWYTSTSLDADAIHRIGLDEVARIEKEMDALLDAQGLREGTVGERMRALSEDPRSRFEDSDAGRTELVDYVEQTLARLQPHLPRYFSHIPPQPLEVRQVPREAQATAPGGYYSPPALDGSRPGVFFINLGDMAANTRVSLPTLAYHEGAPGHHFQISIAQTLDDLPLMRRSLNPSAFSEGWALYVEQLAAEMGLYKDDPWGDLGRLQSELFRSARLVLDTGLHRKRWTPEQAIDYMQSKTGMTDANVRTEVYRYLVQPGQACSYKVGQLKLLELRERARKRLGDRFDIRAFHDVILGNGSLPLAVVEKVVDDWVAKQMPAAEGSVAAKGTE